MTSEARLEYLRSIAIPNTIESPSPYKSQKCQVKKRANRRNKAARQLISDEQKRINNLLETSASKEDAMGVNKKLVPKVTYFNINAPPSMKPPKKYCDITGLNGPYTSPTNNIRYHNSEIYQLIVKPMAPGTDQEYLKLRGANFVLK